MQRDVDEALMRALASARALGFFGPGPIEDHVDSATAFLEAIETYAAQPPALDLGSGGGVPGLVLATWLPDWDWVLLESSRRRAHFLQRVTAELGLAGRVIVVQDRAEAYAHDDTARATFGCVTARSFGPPAATVESACGLLRAGGVLIVADSPGEANRWADAALDKAGMRFVGRHTDRRAVAVVEQVWAADRALPRPPNRQRRDPLF